MVVNNLLPVNAGNGENSYANNSTLQVLSLSLSHTQIHTLLCTHTNSL
ncbi:hypothetical protein RJ641_010980 [Dillenia turbinata]|uniref:Uncharacterized protein n=1 Tax=Dillenia turbinata TaxID=194707 RepID=A0AAN8V3K0_9MAGN